MYYLYTMSTFLFDTIIFGPVWSRRLGESLGINLLPAGIKVCNFNCVYCECGLTPATGQAARFPDAHNVKTQLEEKLHEMKQKGDYLDCITFAGNGEPTLHPDFPRIVNETIQTRNHFFPNVKIAVLSNATLIEDKKIFDALMTVDLNILKLDSAINSTLQVINCPRGNFNLNNIISGFSHFKGRLIIQTLFFRGKCNGIDIDNTTSHEIDKWLDVINTIRPECVMMYSLARDTAVNNLTRISAGELNDIAEKVKNIGIETIITP